MSERGAKVIEFPTWRRQAGGAPGVQGAGHDSGVEGVASNPLRADEHDAHDWIEGWRPIPYRDEAEGFDDPVWHEGVSTTGESVIRLRADLLGIKPPLWRRLEVRGSLTLDRVHLVFAAAFGWTADAEYHFRDVVRDDGGTRIGCTFGNEWTPRRGYVGPMEWTVRLDQVLAGPRSRLRYMYGRRGFDITVVAEDVMPLPPAAAGEVPPARLLTGRRAGPPEDFHTGGMYDLATRGFLTSHPEFADLLQLSLPEDFDPEALDLALLDARVRAAAES